MPSGVNAAMNYPQTTATHASVDRVRTEPKRHELPPGHDPVLPFRQRPDPPFTLESPGATLALRVHLTVHGTVKCTRKRVRPPAAPGGC